MTPRMFAEKCINDYGVALDSDCMAGELQAAVLVLSGVVIALTPPDSGTLDKEPS